MLGAETNYTRRKKNPHPSGCAALVSFPFCRPDSLVVVVALQVCQLAVMSPAVLRPLGPLAVLPWPGKYESILGGFRNQLPTEISLLFFVAENSAHWHAFLISA